ncbi:MAG: hypothetical protein GTN74_10505 [Proteobacteria bacterium]|nr:hypothetical protein [Pseudomonadota bacterium]NIS70575.1 hypothetical protein [Pseudomonadota bacterium]
MIRKILLITIVAVLPIFEGCRDDLIRSSINPITIPDKPYNVMTHGEHWSRYYAVVLDIPDDGVEVVLRETRLTKKLGVDYPRKYIDQFNNLMRPFITLRISDGTGAARGYLLVSVYLKYWTRSLEERIVVTVQPDESYFGYP